MKKFLLILLACLLASCATHKHRSTQLIYSHAFQIPLSSHLISGAKIFYWDELGVKTGSGKVFAGQIVTNEKEKLPENFNIHLYPEYLLKIRPTDDLNDALAQLFENTATEIDWSYGLKSLEIIKEKGQTIYSVCKQDNCLAMMVKNNVTDHILYVHTTGIGRVEFVKILNGVQSVNN